MYPAVLFYFSALGCNESRVFSAWGIDTVVSRKGKSKAQRCKYRLCRVGERIRVATCFVPRWRVRVKRHSKVGRTL